MDLTNLLQEGIEGIRRRRYYYHEDITPMDGEEALTALPSSLKEALIDMVEEWARGVEVGRRSTSYAARLTTQFLSAVGRKFAARLRDSFGILMRMDVRTSNAQQLAASRYELSSSGEHSLIRLYQEWVLRPFLRSSKSLDQETIIQLCDDTVGLLRTVAGVVLRSVANHLGVNMTVRLRYPFGEVQVDIKRTRFYRRPRRDRRREAQVAAVHTDQRPPLVSLSDFPTIGKDWMP